MVIRSLAGGLPWAPKAVEAITYGAAASVPAAPAVRRNNWRRVMVVCRAMEVSPFA